MRGNHSGLQTHRGREEEKKGKEGEGWEKSRWFESRTPGSTILWLFMSLIDPLIQNVHFSRFHFDFIPGGQL